MMDLTGSTRLLKALGDETRLRILNLLAQEELSVTDVVEILNMAQSRVSTQLALLREVGLVRDRRAGRRHYYSLASGAPRALLEQVLLESASASEFEADRAELGAWKDRAKSAARSYFDRVAGSFGEVALPGRTWEGLARAVLQLAPRGRYVDLGIGDGLLTLMLAEIAESVTAVDISPKMLDVTMGRARKLELANIVPVEGRLDDLPLEDASYDVVVLSQALHHADRPERALSEARRILVPGGRVLLLDLLAHSEDWVRDKFHHLHLGFTDAELGALLAEAGFEDVHLQRAARDSEPPHFITLVASGVAAHPMKSARETAAEPARRGRARTLQSRARAPRLARGERT